MTKRIGIFLDDERTVDQVTWLEYPKDISWTTCRTLSGFISMVDSYNRNGIKIDFISFDHDLGYIAEESDEQEITGLTCLKWLLEYYLEHNLHLELPQMEFHTQNPIGKQNMESYLNTFIQVVVKNT